MADDFDVIYEVDGAEEDVRHVESSFAVYVPDPVVIKGAGNITVYAILRLLTTTISCFTSSLCLDRPRSADKLAKCIEYGVTLLSVHRQ